MKKIRLVKILCLLVLLLGITGLSEKVHAANNGIQYRTHVQNKGWQGYVNEGTTSGTSGKALRLEAIQVKNSTGISGNIYYKTHIQSLGWEKDFKKNNEISGTSGQAKRLEAIQIKLDGALGNTYDIYYRVHAQNFGWLGWAKNGASAGTEGYAYRLEAIQIKLIKKGGTAPGSTAKAFLKKEKPTDVQYRTHVQTYGWQSYVKNGASSGTTGKAKRLEGININKTSPYSGNIEYRTHIQNIGWESTFKKNGAMSGTSGRALRLEAIQIKLSGDISNYYDVYYRVHAQNFGWMGWAKNGASSGTAGYAYRLEAIQIKLIKKGSAAPGTTANAYREKPKPVPTKYTVTTIHKSTNGTELKKTTATVEKGKQYTAQAESFKGYILPDVKTQTITVNGNQTITFLYKPSGVSKEEKKELQALYDKLKVTQKGNYTDESWNEFQKQLTTTKTVLDSDSVNMSTIIYMQTQLQKAYDNLKTKAPTTKFNVTVVHKSTDNTILETEPIKSVEQGKQFTANAKSFKDYQLQSNSTQTITVNANATVTFIYKKIEEENLDTVANQIALDAFKIINDFRQSHHANLKPLKYNSIIQKGANIRAKEVLQHFEHERPSGDDYAEAVYDLGYPGTITGENIGKFSSTEYTLDFLKNDSAQYLVELWKQSTQGHRGYLLTGGSNEAAVGIHIEKSGGGYHMGFVFLAGDDYVNDLSGHKLHIVAYDENNKAIYQTSVRTLNDVYTPVPDQYYVEQGYAPVSGFTQIILPKNDNGRKSTEIKIHYKKTNNKALSETQTLEENQYNTSNKEYEEVIEEN